MRATMKVIMVVDQMLMQAMETIIIEEDPTSILLGTSKILFNINSKSSSTIYSQHTVLCLGIDGHNEFTLTYNTSDPDCLWSWICSCQQGW